jgi:hypothetical protein
VWDCDYGYAKHYTNFMGPLLCTNAKYVAAYEEAESIVIAVEYLKTVGEEICR